MVAVTSSARRRTRAAAAGIALAALAGLVAAPPASGHVGSCRATIAGGRSFGPDGGGALARALAVAPAGARIVVEGRCRGAFTIARDVVLAGRRAPGRPVPVLVGTGLAPVLEVGARARISGVRIAQPVGLPIDGLARGIVNHGTLLLARATVTGGAAPVGGGIFNEGELVVVRSSVVTNRAVNGGGIYNVGSLVLRASTVAGNTAEDGDGGGVYDEGRLVLERATVTRNVASWIGGGLYLTRDATFAASVVGGNLAGASGPDCAGPVTSLGWNVVSDTDGFFCAIEPVVGDLIGSGGGRVDAPFGELGMHGGPTPTLLPTADSPAVDRIPVGSRAADGTRVCPARGSTDQRGLPRPVGAGCDVGAVEVGA